MDKLLSYIIELNISLTAFFLLYLLLFRKDSNFDIRRLFLLGAMILSITFPFFNIEISHHAASLSGTIIMLEEFVFSGKANIPSEAGGLLFRDVLLIAYFTITLLLLCRMGLFIIGILRRKINSPISQLFGHHVYNSKKLHASSFFNIIFIDADEAHSENIRHIIEHEACHVKLAHSLDRMIVEIILSISWLNPIAWIYRRSIIINHEYQADNKVIEQGYDQISYQLSILNQYIGSTCISNQFSSQIKKRIKMLNKSYKKGSFWKAIMLLPAGIMLFMFVACGNKSDTENVGVNDLDEIVEITAEKGAKKDLSNTDTESMENQIFYIVEDMPTWENGNDLASELRSFIAKNLDYPDEAIDNGIQGKVFVTFLVTKTGDVVVPDPSILGPEKDDEGNIDEVVVIAYRAMEEDGTIPDEKYIQLLKDEAARVINLVPDVVPGKQRGEAVNVIFTMPIIFALK